MIGLYPRHKKKYIILMAILYLAIHMIHSFKMHEIVLVPYYIVGCPYETNNTTLSYDLLK